MFKDSKIILMITLIAIALCIFIFHSISVSCWYQNLLSLTTCYQQSIKLSTLSLLTL